MIISRTPFRISFFGGGTDYPQWYRQHGGEVLATTIDKYAYVSVRYLPPFFEHKSRIVYSKIEAVREFSEIEHPAVRAILPYMGVTQGIEIHHDGDLPARSGLGSSSSFTVGLIHALSALQNERPSKEMLALRALQVEQDIIKEAVGSQDQICAAYGGFNHIEFRKEHEGPFEVTPIHLPEGNLRIFQDHLMLFFTGFSRIAAVIAQSKIDNFKHRENELNQMGAMVGEAIGYLTRGELDKFGMLLHESWLLKKSLSEKVTTPEVDEIYSAAMRSGALVGKLLEQVAVGSYYSLSPLMPKKR
jgi:D-glycero-alpha-D-manno-heptose-7-phosphate kinase